MNDTQAVKFLIKRCGSLAAAAHALGGISTKRLLNWRRRGISARYRPAFMIAANAYGAGLGPDWLTNDVVPVRIVGPMPTTKTGKTNGRESKKQHAQKAQVKGKAKRSRPQQQRRPAKRRRTTGRSVSAVAL